MGKRGVEGGANTLSEIDGWLKKERERRVKHAEPLLAEEGEGEEKES